MFRVRQRPLRRSRPNNRLKVSSTSPLATGPKDFDVTTIDSLMAYSFRSGIPVPIPSFLMS